MNGRNAYCCLQLAKDGTLNLKHIRFFVLDECDKMLEKLGKLGIAYVGTLSSGVLRDPCTVLAKLCFGENLAFTNCTRVCAHVMPEKCNSF